MAEEKKKVSKKSLEYVRPQPGKYTLEAHAGREFRFRKPTVDDTAWCEATFGQDPMGMIQQKKAPLADLCRLFFRYLDDESKAAFAPREYSAVDDETGIATKVTLGGWRRMMKDIEGGIPEVLSISLAFAQTIFASRPISEMSDEEKKRVGPVLDHLTQAAQPEPQPGPMGSQIIDLRK
jgi:hypothetical protein